MENMEKIEHLIKMPSIAQFRNVITDITHQARFVGLDENEDPIYNQSATLPKINFKGSVKLHGTNASVCYNGEKLWAQSKGNVITVDKDNAGFAMFVKNNEEYFKLVLGDIFKTNPKMEEICVYGEWAGKGIQKGVAIAELDKTFYMFGVKFKVDDEEDYRWAKDTEFTLGIMSKIGPDTVKSMFDYQTFEIEIDFDKPKMAQNKMIEITEEIDRLCPVGEEHGIKGHGEGVVWVGWFNDTRHTFKVKGESHANSKVKTLSPVDEEKEQKKIDFANYATPAWRLEQMYAETFDTLNGGKGDVKMTGVFLKAVVSDVMKEELDEMGARGLEPKEVNGMISKVARGWFMEQLNKENGL